ncbi:protein phosphatase 2C domain-containing protein [Streptomyces sp. NPDC048639]|uniref:protein phosphatase 2C domain-containing protein n=1 Tax=Streptomyces sp. NPDC048639 TaxID=3365581 RepID=UPI0037203A51
MSQMPKVPQLSACPSCHEPLEPGDNFCGACGADVSAAQAAQAPRGGPPADAHATAPVTPPPPQPDSRLRDTATTRTGARPGPGNSAAHPGPSAPEAGAAAGWPAPDPASRSAREAHRPEDLAGIDSADDDRPAAPASAAPDAYPLAPPAAAGEALPPAGSDGPPAGGMPPPADPRTANAYDPAPPRPTVDDSPGGAPGSARGGPAGAPGEVCVACRTGAVDEDGYCSHCGHAQPRQRDHMEEGLDGLAAVSDRGLRHHRNEDAFAVTSTAMPDGSPAVVAVVCDGVSSATRPDEASQAAAEAAGTSLLAALPAGTHPQQAMHDAILAAAEAVNSLAEAPQQPEEHNPHRHHQNSPACTIVSAVVTSGILTVGWVGDSRVYWVPDDRTAPAARLTEDDSWAAQMVATGLMSEQEAYADERAHAITGWLGADAYELEPHTASFKPDRPGVVLVCTDGLWNYAEAAGDLARAVPADARTRPLHSARTLVGYALDSGGHDNVTVAVVPFPSPAPGTESL